MKFTAVIATIVSLAAFAMAAPVANEGMYSFHVNTKSNY
jgi:hypothetical protein